jgi:hypothetical protein
MPERSFYATGDDLLAWLTRVEKGESLRYVELGVYFTEEVPIHVGAASIPGLGAAAGSEKVANGRFMVTASDRPYAPQAVPQTAGGTWYFAEATDDESVILQPGGREGEKHLIEGEVATNYKTDGARALYRRFTTAMRGLFTRHDRVWLGPGATELLDAGYILTYSADAPGRPRIPRRRKRP